MRLRFDADRQWRALLNRNYLRGALPRKNVYGDAPGLVPFGAAYPDKLVPQADYKEVIAECHTAKVFPMYHQKATWCPPGQKWNQNGLPYCWAWGLTAAVKDQRAREGKPTVQLAPVSLGFTVNWAKTGNYLQSAIKGATERGICESKYVPDQHSRSYRQYKDGWIENALLHRLAESWDADHRSTAAMIQHSVSILATGTPLYVAYNWWGHALECVGVEWDESVAYNIVWVLRNSHNEADLIRLTGSRGVPSEAYGIRATAA